jgi:hypothetical protein
MKNNNLYLLLVSLSLAAIVSSLVDKFVTLNLSSPSLGIFHFLSNDNAILNQI